MKSRLDFRCAIKCLLWAVGGGLALATLGCNDPKRGQPTSAVSAEENKVTVLTWDQYFDPSVLKEFTERTGVAVDLQFYDSTAEMLEKLKSDPSQYDLIITEEVVVPAMREGRLLRALEPDLIPNKKNLDDRYLKRSFDPENAYTLPYTWGTTLLAYRKDLLEEPVPHSWSLLLDSRVAGRVSMLDERNECFAVALRSIGANMAEADSASVQKATDLLLRIAKEQKARFGSDNDMKEDLIEGRSWVAQMYSGDAALIATEHDNIAYFIPEEGATIWLDNFALSRDTRRPKNAHLFMNFLAEPQVAARTANFLRYASPNREAQSWIDPKLRADAAIHPIAALLAKCDALPNMSLDQEREMNHGWRAVHSVADTNSETGPPSPAIESPPQP